jgi:iron complex outermembrane receptor protein
MDYDNQFVLTGAQDSNGEMVARNIKDSYRMGVELTMGLRPFKGFNWDLNATFSKNRAKNMNVTVINPDWSQSYAHVGTTHLAYSPDVIVNNMFSYEWKGLKVSLSSKYISEQYMTNSGFKSYLEDDGSYTSAMIDAMFVSDLDLSYTFKYKGLKSATVGVTIYNLFNERYESNGSCSMNFRQNGDKIEAYNGGWAWATYSAQAPTHVLAHLSVNF